MQRIAGIAAQPEQSVVSSKTSMQSDYAGIDRGKSAMEMARHVTHSTASIW
jgi:hypothetical protein